MILSVSLGHVQLAHVILSALLGQVKDAVDRCDSVCVARPCAVITCDSVCVVARRGHRRNCRALTGVAAKDESVVSLFALFRSVHAATAIVITTRFRSLPIITCFLLKDPSLRMVTAFNIPCLQLQGVHKNKASYFLE